MPPTEPVPSAALEVRGLVKRYGGAPVVDGVDLVALRGEVTAVLGPNGAGKTTTVECCEGLRSPDAGTVRVLGQDARRMPAALRARVGVMLQDGGLPGAARPLSLLRHLSRLYAAPRPLDALVDRLGIGGFASTPVRRLSGGQRQRLAMAAALVGDPELVFLDEPTSGLDPQSRLTVHELVRELAAQGAAVVLSTHDMDDAERLADQVVVLDHGRVVAVGPPRELTGAGSGVVLRLTAPPAMDLAGLRRGLPQGTTITEPTPGRYVVAGLVDPQVVAAVTSWCATRDVMPDELSVDRRTLEDVFLELTGRDLR